MTPEVTAMNSTVLMVTDEPMKHAALGQRIEQGGRKILEVRSGSSALERAHDGVDLVVLDATLPDMPPLEAIRALAAFDPQLPVIVLAAEPAVRLDAIKAGAYHAAKTPADVEEVALIAERALEHREGMRALERWVGRERAMYSPSSLIGRSAIIQEVRRKIDALAGATSSVLITGEGGTGREFVARILHAQSGRAAGPFVVVNALELVEDGVLSENGGGGEKGSFIRQARGGTLLLKEIGEANSIVQERLQRLLQRGNVDVRFLATSRTDLRELAQSGRFNADLAARLAAHNIRLPSLRERAEDIELLVQHFVERYARAVDKRVTGISEAARERFASHGFPGNVREIKNVVERAVLHAHGPLLEADDLQWVTQSAEDTHFELPAGGINMRAVEQDLVIQALHLTGGNQTRAAQLLGMNRDQIRYRIAKFHLERGSRANRPPSAN
jgi:DNA-binding NtrC family response regulator